MFCYICNTGSILIKTYHDSFIEIIIELSHQVHQNLFVRGTIQQQWAWVQQHHEASSVAQRGSVRACSLVGRFSSVGNLVVDHVSCIILGFLLYITFLGVKVKPKEKNGQLPR